MKIFVEGLKASRSAEFNSSFSKFGKVKILKEHKDSLFLTVDDDKVFGNIKHDIEGVVHDEKLKGNNVAIKEVKLRIPEKTEKAIAQNLLDDEENRRMNLHLRLNAFAQTFDGKFELPKETLSVVIPEEIKTIVECVRNQQDVVVREFEAQTASRLVVGLGSESVYEVSMTLHHIYGIPYIPGQSLKGAIRNYVISEYYDKDEKKALADKDFCAIFGKEDGAGKVIFYDAYPDEENFQLEKDILTPHYSEYYGGNAWPTDTQKPIPNEFLTVPKGKKFRFFLGLKKGKKEDSGLYLDMAERYLKEALENFGVGAKTAVGYGYFKELPYHVLQVKYSTQKEGELIHSTLQAIMKETYMDMFPGMEWKNQNVPNLFYHVEGKRFDSVLKKGEIFTVLYFFCGIPEETVAKFADALKERMEKTENQNYYKLESVGKPCLKTLANLRRDYAAIPEKGEVVLDLMMPLPFKPCEETGKVFTKEMFAKSLVNRMKRLFGKAIPDTVDLSSVDLKTELEHKTLCTHQKDGVYGQRIHGCVGKITLSGDLTSIRDLLLLACELHLGPELTTSQGYFEPFVVVRAKSHAGESRN